MKVAKAALNKDSKKRNIVFIYAGLSRFSLRAV